MNNLKSAETAQIIGIKSNKFKSRFSHIALLAGATALLGACASMEDHAAANGSNIGPNGITPAAGGPASKNMQVASADDAISDPFEKSNRAIFKFNNGFDHDVLNPVIKGYRNVVPQPARTGLRNFLRNLKTPTTFANALLQGDFTAAGKTLLRFAVNSTVGVAGLIDVAGHHGVKYEEEDFGKTMGVWGIGNGPYLVVPLIGPSSLRDYAGYFVDGYADPLRWWLFNTHNQGWYYAKVGLDYFDLRDSVMDVLEDLEKSSIDYYAAVRSTYYQRRQAMIKGQSSDTGGADFDDLNKE